MTCSTVPLYRASAAALALSAPAPVTGDPKPGGTWPFRGAWPLCGKPRAPPPAAAALAVPELPLLELALPRVYAPNAITTAAMPATAYVAGFGEFMPGGSGRALGPGTEEAETSLGARSHPANSQLSHGIPLPTTPRVAA